MTVEQVMSDLRQHHPEYQDLLEYVVQEAADYWRRANCLDDFGLQLAQDEVLIFGGTNRVVWSVRSGFRVDIDLCTSKFLCENSGQAGCPLWDPETGSPIREGHGNE